MFNIENNKKKVIIGVIGSNIFDNYLFFEKKMYEILERYFEEEYEIILREQEDTLIDNFVAKFAKENDCKLQKYKVNWDSLGKKAKFENIKKIIYGEEAKSSINILLIFKNRWDVDNTYISKVLNEFKSIIDLDNFTNKNYFIFYE